MENCLAFWTRPKAYTYIYSVTVAAESLHLTIKPSPTFFRSFFAVARCMRARAEDRDLRFRPKQLLAAPLPQRVDMMEIGRLDDLSIVLLCKKCDRVAGEYDPSEPNERIRKCPNPKCSDTEPWFPSFPDQGPEFLYVKQLKEALQAAIDLVLTIIETRLFLNG